MASDTVAAQAKVKGTVASLNEPDGFGIISIVTQNNNEAKNNEEAKQGYLARLSDIRTEGWGIVSVGQRVEFVAATGDDGKPVALDVTVIGGAAAAPGTADDNGSKAPDVEKANK